MVVLAAEVAVERDEVGGCVWGLWFAFFFFSGAGCGTPVDSVARWALQASLRVVISTHRGY
jgi:hypothetical protein